MKRITDFKQIKKGDYLLFIYNKGNSKCLAHVTKIDSDNMSVNEWDFIKTGDDYKLNRRYLEEYGYGYGKAWINRYYMRGTMGLFKLNKQESDEWNDKILLEDL